MTETKLTGEGSTPALTGEASTAGDLAELRGLLAKATPGPWNWYGSTHSRCAHIATVHGGRRYVMGFRRWGMGSAQPTFQVNSRMVPMSELVRYDVDKSVKGATAAKTAESVYREDFSEIDAPDAQLIVAAVNALPGLLDRVEKAEGERDDARDLLMGIAGRLELPRSVESGPPDDPLIYERAIDHLEDTLAATEIERKRHAEARFAAEAQAAALRTRLEEAREALLEIAGSADGQVQFVVSSAHRKVIELARATLSRLQSEGGGE